MFIKQPSQAMKSDGTLVPYEPGVGFKLATGTWYIDVSMSDAKAQSVHCAWDATFACSSLQWEGSNLPAFKGAPGSNTDSDSGADVALNDSTAGNWVVPNSNTTNITAATGVTVTDTSIAVTTANAGGSMISLLDYSRRGRLAIVVTTAGYFRCDVHGKQA